jgi:hypothetical protein
MTWNELGQFIEQMDPAKRAGTVKFIEPYDKERAGHCVTASYAVENVMLGEEDGQEDVFVRLGEPFLE